MKLESHVKEIENLFVARHGSKGFPNLCSHLRAKLMTPKRIRWDMLHTIKTPAQVCEYYKIDGVNDDHIDTMLRKAFFFLGMPWYANKVAPRTMEMKRLISDTVHLEGWHSGDGQFEMVRASTNYKTIPFRVKNYSDVVRIAGFEDMVLRFYKQFNREDKTTHRDVLADTFSAAQGHSSEENAILRQWANLTMTEDNKSV